MAKNTIKIRIATKLTLLAIFVSLLLISSNVIIFNSFVKEFRSQNKALSVYAPSITKLTELDNIKNESLSLLKTWIFIDKDTGSVNRKDLEKIHKLIYPQFKQDYSWYVEQWDKEEQNQYFDLIASFDSLISKEAVIMGKLSFFEDYQNTEEIYTILLDLGEGGNINRHSKYIDNKINKLKSSLEDQNKSISENISKNFIRIKRIILWFSILMLIFIAFIVFALLNNLKYIISVLNSTFKKLNQGLLTEIKELKRSDEIGEVNRNLIGVIKYLKELSTFADYIGQNKFDVEFSPKSDGDVLGNALLRMRDNLVKAKQEEESRQKENTERNWASQGIAVFNEVIRDNSNNLDDLTNAVIEKLVNYTGSNIGGMYIVNDENEFDKFLELKSFYAYDRHKFIERKVKFGETLIGQCYVENDTIFITEVPDDYIYITSGLGSDKPSSILIVPLRFNETTYGVVELASFKIFEDYKIEFIEKISETIASAISTVKIRQRTEKLFEESNEKSKRLEQQEILARKNIEELKKQIAELEQNQAQSKEEIEKIEHEKNQLLIKIEQIEKEAEAEKQKEQEKHEHLLQAINNVAPYFEMNINGDITYTNELYAKLLNIPATEISGTKHINYISRDFINSGNYKQIWDKIKTGEKVNTSVQYLIDGKSRYINEQFVPITDKNDRLIKVSVFSNINIAN